MIKEIWEWTRSIIIAIVLALLFRMFIFEHFLVDGQSMYPTLRDSERIIVNKLTYRFHEPDYHDIIVFRYRDDRDFIKRIVAMEGDTVQIKDNQLYLNGKVLKEPYLEENSVNDYGPVTVPENHYFVLGDNRANSRDSRYEDVGFVAYEDLKGQAYLVFWPIDELRVLN